MRFLEEYRDAELCRQLVANIHRSASRRWTLMEVCGGQTHSLLRYGIDQVLEESVRLIHGPGCPVCVTPAESIDRAIELARRPEVILTSFGDMLRVPGSGESLLRARSEGADVRIVYSPLDAVALAQRERGREVIFFAVGFETTAPATAIALQQAAALQLENFRVLPAHVRVEPAMEQLAAAPDRLLDGFLAAGHVCTITGFRHYERLATQYQLPIVVTGFEPADLLLGIWTAVRQLEAGAAEVVNCYQRSSESAGNLEACRLIDEVFQPCDRAWRGLGIIRGGGYELKGPWKRFDATEWQRMPHGVSHVLLAAEAGQERDGMARDDQEPMCRSGEVLTGVLRPTECEHFGTRCTPQQPLGAPMVSHEGACAAYFHYRPHEHRERAELP